jgi:AraC-like DNA-binding protein
MWLPQDKLQSGLIPRHRHAKAYAALVVSGHYEEAGDAGRYLVTEGDILVHRAHEAHQNLIGSVGALVLNLPLPNHINLPSAFKIADPSAFLKERDLNLANAYRLLEPIEVIRALDREWPDQLARDLTSDLSMNIRAWATRNGLAAATVSRGFKRAFGVSPIRFRAEARARRALDALTTRKLTLAELTHDLGFADQPHMSRAVRALVKTSPSKWRQINSVQDQPE